MDCCNAIIRLVLGKHYIFMEAHMKLQKFLFALILLSQSHMVSAIQVNPASFVFLNGTTSAAQPELAGFVQNDNLISFSGIVPVGNDFGGEVQNRVVLSNVLQTLIFAPRIRDTFIEPASRTFVPSATITGFQLDGYAGFSTDINYRTDGLGDEGPDYVIRSNDGDELTFAFIDGLQITEIDPEESLFPSILTDATDYELTGTMVIFGYYNGNPIDTFSIVVDGIAVPTAVPLPPSILLFGSTLLGLVTVARKK